MRAVSECVGGKSHLPRSLAQGAEAVCLILGPAVAVPEEKDGCRIRRPLSQDPLASLYAVKPIVEVPVSKVGEAAIGFFCQFTEFPLGILIPSLYRGLVGLEPWDFLNYS